MVSLGNLIPDDLMHERCNVAGILAFPPGSFSVFGVELGEIRAHRFKESRNLDGVRDERLDVGIDEAGIAIPCHHVTSREEALKSASRIARGNRLSARDSERRRESSSILGLRTSLYNVPTSLTSPDDDVGGGTG